MRARPLLQWIVFLLGWAVLAYPILRVTATAEQQVQQDDPEATQITTWITLSFSTPPASFSLSHDGHILWHEMSPRTVTFERTVAVPFDAYGTELVLEADLPEGRHAVEVTLEPDAMAPRARTVWATGAVDERLEFGWEPHD